MPDGRHSSTGTRSPPTSAAAVLRRTCRRSRAPLTDITGARVLAVLGDSRHHRPHLARRQHREGQPGRQVPAWSTACKPEDFNTYGARRGNHEVMVRGTFANIRLKNLMRPRRRGRRHRAPARRRADVDLRRGDEVPERRRAAGRPRRQGVRHRLARATGRPRAPMLLGVRAVIAESFERIHRSNLVGMGVLPLQFADGQNVRSAGPDRPRDLRDRRHRQGLRPAQAADREGRRRRARPSSSRPWSASTRPTSSSTTARRHPELSCSARCSPARASRSPPIALRPREGWDLTSARRGQRALPGLLSGLSSEL